MDILTLLVAVVITAIVFWILSAAGVPAIIAGVIALIVFLACIGLIGPGLNIR